MKCIVAYDSSIIDVLTFVMENIRLLRNFSDTHLSCKATVNPN